MRVTRKGQVTIPKHIRDKLGIEPGGEVEFVDRGENGVEVIRSTEPDERAKALERFERWLVRIEGTGDSGLSADDVMNATRDRDVRDDY